MERKRKERKDMSVSLTDLFGDKWGLCYIYVRILLRSLLPCPNWDFGRNECYGKPEPAAIPR